jgi:hypothetical protein
MYRVDDVNPHISKSCAVQKEKSEAYNLLRFPPAAGSANVVEGDRSSAEKDKSKSKSGKSQRKFVAVLTHQSVV